MVKKSVTNKKNATQDSSINSHPIVVGIGGSAGGLEAFSTFLENMPATTGMAFVFISHLSPNHKSQLTELLSRKTRMPVSEAANDMLIESNHVYVIPPKVKMSISNGKLVLISQKVTERIQMPIDCFFLSLAKEELSRAIGVILSGTATDGTRGAEAIKAEGGITFAQDNISAKYNGMPHSAIAAGFIDFVLPPEKIAAELQNIAKHPYISGESIVDTKSDIETQNIAENNPLKNIFSKLFSTKGVDFSYYKPSTINRRILRRMALLKLHKLDDYEKILYCNNDEIENLYNDLLLNVTGFYRDPKVFDLLKKHILPAIFNNKAKDQPIRIWVPGCSGGEESYSIAICLCEVMEINKCMNPIQIFATDVNQNNIDKARHGVYDKSIEESVSSVRLRRYFTKIGDSYKVSSRLREMCIFSRQNVFTDPPFSSIDFISCRNLLIYLQPVMQKKIFQNFNYSLTGGGFLLLGNSESAGSYSNLFKAYDNKLNFFIKKHRDSRSGYNLTSQSYLSTKVKISKNTNASKSINKNDFENIVDSIILNEFAPCGVLIDSNMEVLHYHGFTGRFLVQSTGQPSFDIFKLAKKEIQLPLRTAIYEAGKTKHKVQKVFEYENTEHNTEIINISITVIPLESNALKEEVFLVLFDEISVDKRIKSQKKNKQPFNDGKYIESILKELNETKIYLQSVIEEQESANEEILASNEELQSANEELETSKEELQSANEELATTNQELQNRNVEITLLNNDLINLLNSINMPVVMMDTDIVIRRITPQADRVLNIVSSDIGRPISKIKLNIDIPDLEQTLRCVIETLQPKILEAKDKEKNGYSIYIRPYRTTENKIDGVIAVFVDITKQIKAQQLVENARIYAESIVETIKEPLIVLNSTLKVVSANTSFYQMFRIKSRSTVGQLIYDLDNRQWDIPALRLLLEDLLPEKSILDNYKIENEFENIGKKTILLNARKLSKMEMILISLEDITEQSNTSKREQLSIKVLSRLNQPPNSIETIIGDIIHIIKEHTGIEAIGIRLAKGNDFPYYQTCGFSKHFLKMENHLCEQDKKGNIVVDAQGKPLLECMCGKILRGKTDTAFPFFTEGGSFWSNCTTELLTLTAEKEQYSHNRNRCNSEGYESVALIPIQSENEIIGLLQLNDHRKNRFTPEMINFFEGLAASLGTALAREKARAEAESLSKFPSENFSPIMRIGLDGKLLYFNKACMNLPVEFNLQIGQAAPPIFKDIACKAKKKKTGKTEIMLGERFYIFSYSLIQNADYFNLYGIDITEQKQNEINILELNKQQQSMLDSSPVMIFYKDRENHFIRVNKAFAEINAMTKEEMTGKSMWEIYPKEIADNYWQDDKDIFLSGKPKLNIIETLKTPNGLLNIHVDKYPSMDLNGNIIGIIGFVQDMTEITLKEKELQKQHAKLEHLATFDNLTGIANRYTFQKSANLIFQSAKRYGRKFAVLTVDIDNFKWINDQYGHDIGDIVLQSTTYIINQNLREGDLFARLGGDEFGIILSEIENIDDAGVAADKIVKLFKKPLEIKGKLITCSVSIGIACFPSNDVYNFDTLLKQADMAMYKAKENGRNCFDFFSISLRNEYYKKIEIENELKKTLKSKKFYLVYQPIVDMRNSKINGVEALLRMPKSSKLGEIPPSVFIPVAEKLNLIHDIGLLAFEKICRDIKEWTRNGANEIFYSINISPKQMNMENFWRHFKSIIYEYNIDSRLIELEVTETMFGTDFDNYIDEWLKNFKNLNLKLSIDDFGTGYSSLSRLGILPMNTIKIDGSFVSQIGKNEKNNSIIKNIIRLADSLSVKTIAEFVETKEQVDFLLKNGCHFAQGYYYHKPLMPEKIFNLLKQDD